MSASVFDISSEKISEPASIVNGVSSPRLFAIPILLTVKRGKVRSQNSRILRETSSDCERKGINTYARAVLPVPGWPPMRMALPAILPSLIMLRMTPAARLAST